METLIKGLIGLAALAFVLAVVEGLLLPSPILGVTPEGFSRASNNLALLAIALSICLKEGSAAS
jgi:hypothetical protein